MTLKLGSLFSGSGGFELAGSMNGIKPVWASEIEKYPVAVTTARFPNMKHLGDITKINGAEIEPVDIVTFGFPCQDLSVAGKQAGLHGGERSILFYEAVRIIKEMRNITGGVYPRIAIFENVPGLFSSRKGEDFRAVLETLIRVKDPDAVVPQPPKGKWLNAGCIVGNGYSLAYRLFDAQFWGVPQRRKRIYAITDFGGECTGEILFEQEGLRGDTTESGTAGQGIAKDAEGSVGRGCVAWTYRGREGGCNIEYIEEVAYALRNPLGGGSNANICYPTDYVCEQIDLIRESRGAFEKYEENADKAGSLKQCDNKGSQVVCYSIREDAKANTFSATESDKSLCLQALQPAPTSHHAQNYVVEKCYRKTGHPRNSEEGQGWEETDRADTLNVFDNSENRTPLAVVKSAFSIENHPNDSRIKIDESGLVQTLSSRMGTGGGNTPMVLEMVLPPPEKPVMVLETYSAGNGQLHQALEYERARPLDCMHDQQIVLHPSKPPRKYIIRRLTPLECCRLQGFPDWWENGVAGSDSGRYKMWGNGIALPNAEFVVRKAKQLLTSKQNEIK